MGKIDLAEITEDTCARTMILAFQTMGEEGVIHKKEVYERIVNKYLGDFLPVVNAEKSNIFFSSIAESKMAEECQRIRREAIKNDYEGSHDYMAESYEHMRKFEYAESMMELSNIFNADIYNLMSILDTIDQCIKLDEEILIENSLNDFERAQILLMRKSQDLARISLGVSNFIIRIEQNRGMFSEIKHYNIAPNMAFDIKTHRKFQNSKILDAYNESERLKWGDCYLTDFFLLVDLYRIRQQCSLEKLLISLIFIIRSPEYDKIYADYAYALLGILCEISYCGNIHMIYMQEGFYNCEKNSGIISSDDATTRISIVFSAANEDFFILRVDLPHKGENCFHINMEEVIDGKRIAATGYPIEYKELCFACPWIEISVIQQLFYEMNNMCWFRADFLHLIEHMKLSLAEKNDLLSLFHKQAHMEIKVEGEFNEGSALQFTNEIKKYIGRFGMNETRFLRFGRDNIDYIRIIRKYRFFFILESKLLDVTIKNIEKEVNPRVTCEMLLRKCSEFMNVCIPEESIASAKNIADTWDILKQYLFQ